MSYQVIEEDEGEAIVEQEKGYSVKHWFFGFASGCLLCCLLQLIFTVFCYADQKCYDRALGKARY